MEIQAANNHLSNLRFVVSSSLRILNLSRNKISDFVLTENDFPNLQKLVLDFNNIRVVESLSHNSLRVLSLANNQIKVVRELALKQLVELNLSYNSITELDMKLVRCYSLTRLDLCRFVSLLSLQSNTMAFYTQGNVPALMVFAR